MVNRVSFQIFCYFDSFISLILPVPPVIEPFSFPGEGLPEGSRTRMVCGVSRGDPPLHIGWLKDGAKLPPHLGVNVSTLDPYSSLLSIPSLTEAHSGEYTCVASNPAARVRYTSRLQVKGKRMPSYSVCSYFGCFGTRNAPATMDPRFVSRGNLCTFFLLFSFSLSFIFFFISACFFLFLE